MTMLQVGQTVRFGEIIKNIKYECIESDGWLMTKQEQQDMSYKSGVIKEIVSRHKGAFKIEGSDAFFTDSMIDNSIKLSEEELFNLLITDKITDMEYQRELEKINNFTT